MRFIFSTLLILSAFAAQAGPKISCELVDEDRDSWAVEIWDNRAAFFDNDRWAAAIFDMSLESDPPISVYESTDSDDPFTIQIVQEDNGDPRSASITVELDGEQTTLDLKCEIVNELMYLE